MKLLRAILILFTSLFLASCASSYKPVGLIGSYGYKETALSENVYNVNYTGNPLTSLLTTYNYAMMRSAELASSHHYPYFVVLSKKSYIRTENDGQMTMSFPSTELKVKFVQTKTADAYTVSKIFQTVKIN